MKKLLIAILTVPFFLVSCGKSEETKAVVNLPVVEKQVVATLPVVESSTGKVEEVATGVVSESGSIIKIGIETKIGKDFINYQIALVEGSKILYLMKNGTKTEVNSTDGDIQNVEFLNGLLIYDYISTGGSVKRVYNIDSMKEIGAVRFGEFTKDQKYIYGCEDGGYGPGGIQVFNLLTFQKIDLSKELSIGEDETIVEKCSFDENSHNITFMIDKGNNPKSLTKSKNYIYNLDTNSLKEVFSK